MGLAQKDLTQLYIKICSGMDHSYMLDPEPDFAQIDKFWLDNPHKPLLERVSDYDLKTYLNNDINTKVDRASMAYAIETRSPLMDYRVVEFARSLPTSFKMEKQVQKRILKDILFKKVPAEYYNRPKSGFSVPLEKWFRNELKEYVLDTLTPKKLANIPGINVGATIKMIGKHMDGKWNRSARIWSLLVLSQWLESQAHVNTPSNALML
jgi:asparagine synthase (glutamine-hydrolysing)